MQTVSVAPAETGWAVRSNAIDNHMMFKSGAKAEHAARQLAKALARGGEPVELRIHLRDGALAGRFIVPPPRTSHLVRRGFGWPGVEPA